MSEKTARTWIVDGFDLDTGEEVSREFEAENEALARAMAQVSRIAVGRIKEVPGEAGPDFVDRAHAAADAIDARMEQHRKEQLWKQIEKDRLVSAFHVQRGRTPVYIVGIDGLVGKIAWGIVGGVLLFWLLSAAFTMLLLGGSCAAIGGALGGD
jgi:hypothetical protein